VGLCFEDIIDPCFTAQMVGKEAGGWRYEVLTRAGDWYMGGVHNGTKAETKAMVERLLERINKADRPADWIRPGKAHNTKRAIERRRKFTYDPGTVLASCTIVRVVELRPQSKFTRYQVRVDCCGSDRVMTGQVIQWREKQFRLKGAVSCRNCRGRGAL
jgi:hypothetical protein